MANVPRPIQRKPVEALHINEGSEMSPLRLSDYIVNPPDEASPITYQASLSTGKSLPRGIVLKDDVLSGRPARGTHAQAPYEVRIIAKNSTAVPLVVRFELYIHEGQVMTGESQASSESFPMLSEAVEDLFMQHGMLDEAVYNELFILYFIRKWGSICIFDAGKQAAYYNEPLTYEGSSGWTIYDDGALLRTTNPKAVSTTFSTSGMISTLNEMIAIAANRNWEKVGVMGCAANVGYHLIVQHNRAQMRKAADKRQILQIDNPIYESIMPKPKNAPS